MSDWGVVPRFIKAGESNKRITTTSCYVSYVTLTSKSGAASLSLYNSATSTINVTSAQNRLFVRAGGVSSPATQHLHLFRTLFATGLVVSCNGAGARAVIGLDLKTRGQ